MKFLDNIICLEYHELVPRIMSKSTYDVNKFRKNFKVFGTGGNGREILISFESLPAKYREAVVKEFGNPYEYLAKEPIAEQVRLNWDFEAENFYNDIYELPNGSVLPPDYIKKYIEAASWLKTLEMFNNDKRALKRQLNITITEFWEAATAVIRAKGIALPTNPRALKNKLAKFRTSENKYASLVEEWRFGNENTKKIKDEVAEALLIEMCAHHNHHDDTIIALKYNEWAKSTGRLTISPSTVGYRRKQNEHLITMQRDGISANYTKYSKQILSERPSAPLLLAMCDDNILDLYFRKETTNRHGKTVVNDQYRVAMYVVKDYYNDYVLGYAIGETVTKELIYAAFRDAIEHISQLTNGNYLFHQLQSDRWAIDKQLKGELAMYFKSLTHYTPGTVKASQTKRIEHTFNSVWHQQLKLLPYNNYAGHNVTAGEKLNPDAILALKKNYPSADNASEIVAHFIHNMRHSINAKTGLDRQIEWLEAFKASEKSQKRQISNEQRIQLFGVAHKEPAKITSGNLKFQINNQKYVYEIPDRYYLPNVGKSFQVMYEPAHMDRVLVTDGKGVRFLATSYERVPSAIADYKPGDRERINNLLNNKSQMMNGIQEAMNNRLEILSRSQIDAQSVLQSGVANSKEVQHKAAKVISGGFTDFEDSEDFDFTNLM